MTAAGQIAGSVTLALASLPIHELGHSVALRMLTGAWPHFGIFAVEPTTSIPSAGTALMVLAAGDIAVVLWWWALFLTARRKPAWKLALVGPTFVLAVTLFGWLVSAALFPVGYAALGNSDAAKFLAILRVKRWVACAAVGGTDLVMMGVVGAVAHSYVRARPGSSSDGSSGRS